MSRLIKSDFYITLNQSKLIETVVVTVPVVSGLPEELTDDDLQENEQLQLIKMQIIKDAEEYAEQHINEAMLEADALKARTEFEIEQWWQDKRKEDDEHISEAKSRGYEVGYQEGLIEAEAVVKDSYTEMIVESQTILEQAYQLKEQIIQESEPFLIELSCAISEKIIQRQLTLSPAWVIEYTKAILSRRREKGQITICVAPQQFSFMQDAKDEFMLHIDSQAELQILPDATVSDHGCVIRSPFLSVDARIDTQLKEIKHALQLIAQRNESVLDHE